MASSSFSSIKICENAPCGTTTEFLLPGWKSGDRLVKLCYQCFTQYSCFQFCDLYHKELGDWTLSCVSCGKKFHRDCVVAYSSYATTETGIMCKYCMAEDANLTFAGKETSDDSTSTPTPHASGPVAFAIQPESQLLALEHDGNGPPTLVENDLHLYDPKMTKLELQQIYKGLNERVIQLFEQVLTNRDAGSGRLVLPTNCAQKCFPYINDQERIQLVMQDAEGLDWEFPFRISPINNSQMYVLEEFDPYVQAKRLSAGDTVTFCQLRPETKLVIGYRRKASASSSNQLPDIAIASPSTVRHKKGIVKSKTNSGAKGKKKVSMLSMVSQGKQNNFLSVQSDMVAVKVPFAATRKHYEAGSTSKSAKKKHKISEVDHVTTKDPKEKLVTEDQNATLASLFSQIIARKSTTKRASKGKNKLAPRGSKGKGKTVAGSPTRLAKKAPSKEKSITEKIKSITPRRIASLKKPKSGNVDTEPPATAQAQLKKKHPRHKPECKCVICVQPPSGTKHPPDCACLACVMKTRRINNLKNSTKNAKQKRPVGPPNKRTKNAKPKPTVAPPAPTETVNAPEPEPALPQTANNSDQQPSGNAGEVNENETILEILNSGSMELSFDLNELPEPDDV